MLLVELEHGRYLVEGSLCVARVPIVEDLYTVMANFDLNPD